MKILAIDRLLRLWHSPPEPETTQPSPRKKCARSPQSLGTTLSFSHMMLQNLSVLVYLPTKVHDVVKRPLYIFHFLSDKGLTEHDYYTSRDNHALKKYKQEKYLFYSHIKTSGPLKLAQRYQFHAKHFLTRYIESISLCLRKISAPDAFSGPPRHGFRSINQG